MAVRPRGLKGLFGGHGSGLMPMGFIFALMLSAGDTAADRWHGLTGGEEQQEVRFPVYDNFTLASQPKMTLHAGAGLKESARPCKSVDPGRQDFSGIKLELPPQEIQMS